MYLVCKICGGMHNSTYCNLDASYEQIANTCASNLFKAGIISEAEVVLAVQEFKKLTPSDLIASLIETHYLRENRPADIMCYPINSQSLSRS